MNFPTESWGRQSIASSDSKNKLNLCSMSCVLQATLQSLRKENKRRVHTGSKEKRAVRAKFVVFPLLIGLVSFDLLIAVAVVVAYVIAPRINRCA